MEFALPAGRYHLHVHHGIEYKMAHLQFDVAEGRTTSVQAEVERWTDPQARGWYSGENHIHANYGYGSWYNTPEEMRRMIEAEGLNVANFVVANSDTDGVFDREFFRGRPDPNSGPRNILYWNEEFRATPRERAGIAAFVLVAVVATATWIVVLAWGIIQLIKHV